MASLHLQSVLLPNWSKVNCISAFSRSFEALRSIPTSLEKISFLPLFHFLLRASIVLFHLFPQIRISSRDPIFIRVFIPILNSTCHPLIRRIRAFILRALSPRHNLPRIHTIFCQTRTLGFRSTNSKTTKIGSELWRTRRRKISRHAALLFLPHAHFPPFSPSTPQMSLLVRIEVRCESTRWQDRYLRKESLLRILEFQKTGES